MQWGIHEVQRFAGENLILNSDIYADFKKSDYSIALHDIQGDALKAQAKINLNKNYTDGKGINLATLAHHLDAQIDFDVNFAEHPKSNFSGDFTGNLNLQGKLDKLALKAKVSTPRLDVPTQYFSNITAELEGTANPFNAGEVTKSICTLLGIEPYNSKPNLTMLSGKLKIDSLLKDNVPFMVDSDWDLSWKLLDNTPKMAFSVQVENTVVSLKDLQFRGYTQVVLPRLNKNIPNVVKPALHAGNSPNSELPSVYLLGELDADFNDWGSLSDYLNLRIFGGVAKIKAKFTAPHNKQSLTVDIENKSIQLRSGIDNSISFFANNLQGHFEVADLFNNTEFMFTLNSNNGRYEKLHWDYSSFIARLDQTELKSAVTIWEDKQIKKLLLTEQNLDFKNKKASQVPLHNPELFSLLFSYDLKEQKITIPFLNLRDTDRVNSIQLGKELVIDLKDAVKVEDLQVLVNHSGKISGSLNSKTGEDIERNLQLSLEKVPLSISRMFTNLSWSPGFIDAEFSFEQKGQEFKAALDSNINMLAQNILDATNTKETLKLQHNFKIESDKRLIGAFKIIGQESAEEATATLTYDLPLKLNEQNKIIVNADKNFKLNFNWAGESAHLWQFLPMPDSFLNGYGHADIELTGTFNKPKIRKSVLYLINCSYEDDFLGVFLNEINLESYADSQGIYSVLSAKDGRQGSLKSTSTLNVNIPALLHDFINYGRITPEQIVKVTSHGQVEHLAPFHREDIELQFSGIYTIKGNLDDPNVNAHINIENGDITLSPDMYSTTPNLEITNQFESIGIRPNYKEKYNIQVDIPGRLFIRGLGLNSEWQGNLTLNGTIDNLRIAGKLSPVRGTLDLLSRTFNLESGDITFTATEKINPLLNLNLQHVGTNITALIKIRGTDLKPLISLTSVPDMPQSQILSEIIFNKGASKLSRFEALQLASALKDLNDLASGKPSMLSNIRKQTGIDVLRIGGGSSNQYNTSYGAPNAKISVGKGSKTVDDDLGNTATLEAGKYINDITYIAVEQGVSEDSTGIRIEIELAPILTCMSAHYCKIYASGYRLET